MKELNIPLQQSNPAPQVIWGMRAFQILKMMRGDESSSCANDSLPATAGAKMQAVTGVFLSQTRAEQSVRKLQSIGVPPERVTFLTPGGKGAQLESVPVDATEQPGIGTAFGSVLGAAAGLSGGLAVAFLPGVGPVTAIGILGAAVLSAAGATLGAVAGGSLDC